tara:strand:+ start:376 stop:858 length:483 start_codon:yes stop_codon:yes gene_type:complete
MVTAVLFYQSSLALAGTPRLQKDGPIARDYVQKLEWMRCSIGMVWDNDTCVGEIMMLSIGETEELLNRIRDLNGGGWRLPTVKELKSLVTIIESRPKDIIPNIDQETFPGTYAGLYWSSDQSFYARKYQWAVNFLTGHSYNRSFPYQKLAVRLVRNYQIK